MARAPADNRVADGSNPSSTTNNKDEKKMKQHRQTLRMCDRSGERAGLLIWWRASAQRGFESRHILQIMLQTLDQLP